MKTGWGVRCAAAVNDENATARNSNAARPRLALPLGCDPHKAAELSRRTLMGASQQTNALGQPPLFSLHQKDGCQRNAGDQNRGSEVAFPPDTADPGWPCGSPLWVELTH